MKYMRTLGLTATAVATVVAFAGASTAVAADRLCETNTTPCTSPVAANGSITFQAAEVIVIGETEFTCASSTTTFKVTKNDGTVNPTGEITALSWTNCKDLTHGIACAVTAQNLPYHAEITTPGPNLTIKPHLGGGGPGMKFSCGMFLVCTYQRPDFTLPVDVGAPAAVTMEEVEYEKVGGGGLCPREFFLDANYVAESPTSSLLVTSS